MQLKVSKWLFDSVQDDLKELQVKYEEIGYRLTLEQCYEVWYLYSEDRCANWLSISNVSNSIPYVKKVLDID